MDAAKRRPIEPALIELNTLYAHYSPDASPTKPNWGRCASRIVGGAARRFAILRLRCSVGSRFFGSDGCSWLASDGCSCAAGRLSVFAMCAGMIAGRLVL